MIEKETYLEMKKLIEEYENAKPIINKVEEPYIEVISIEKEYKYNSKFGDTKTCTCGHSYYRHFDTYEGMYNIGCKYCGCDHFEEINPL